MSVTVVIRYVLISIMTEVLSKRSTTPLKAGQQWTDNSYMNAFDHHNNIRDGGNKMVR